MAKQIPLYSKNFGRLTGEEAWRQNLDLAAISASKIESSLGPKGAYKMVNYHRGPEHVVKVTKDAVEVLSELEVQYPAVKTIAEAARIQRDHAGDGVATFVILLGGLLQEARHLAERGLHPITILRGYHYGLKEALKVIDEAAYHAEEDAPLRLLALVDCGRGILSGALLHAVSEATLRAQDPTGIDVNQIRMIKEAGGTTAGDSDLFRGIVIKKGKAHPGMPDVLDAVKVALVGKKLDIRPMESLMKSKGPFNLKLQIEQNGDLRRLRSEETRLRKGIAATLAASGAKLVICRSKIAEAVADELSRQGILALDLVDAKDLDAIAEATGGVVVGDIDDLRANDLGIASRAEMKKVEGIDHAWLEAEKGSTILIRGSSAQGLQEAERLVKSGLTVLKRSQKDPRVVPGGGAIYTRIALAARKRSLDYGSREQLAVQAFADVMERVPTCLAGNFGLKRASVMTELRGHHAAGRSSMGVAEDGCMPMEDKVEELASITNSVVQRACEVATLLLRIDDYFYVKELPMVHKK